MVEDISLPGIDLSIFGDSVVDTDPSPESGRDSALIRSSVLGSVGFRGGLDEDWLGIYDSEIGSLNGTGGGGRDTFELRRSIVAGDLNWNDRSGPGGIYFEANQIDGATSIATTDSTASFPVWVHLFDNQFGSAALTTGNGNDRLIIQNNALAIGDFGLFTGDGDDDILR